MKELTVEMTQEQVYWMMDLCLAVALAQREPVLRPIQPMDAPIAASIIARCIKAMYPTPTNAPDPATSATQPAATTSAEPGSSPD